MGDHKSLAVVILAAGQGTRMKSSLPKALHKLAGRPLIAYLIETAESLSPDKIIVVTAPDAEALRDAVAPHDTVIQQEPRGTGDAVKAALPLLAGFNGDVLILLGDMPLISEQTLRALIAERYKDTKTGLSVLGAELDPPPAFGRLVLDDRGALARIVEDKDCSAAERAITLCNTGAFCVDGLELPGWLERLETGNAQGEYYITDIVGLAAKDGIKTHAFITRDNDEVRGINSRADLAALEAIVQQKLRAQVLTSGTTLIDPDSVFLSWDTALGRDVVIEPHVFFGPGVRVGDNVTIRAFSHIEGAAIEAGAQIGPFARIRPRSRVGENAVIGNFIEVNRSTVGPGAKAKHVTYLGDTTVGEKANIGAGTIVANYDGYEKHDTQIGAQAFIGSNVTIVAPVSVGTGAIVAAGSTITYDVPEDALAIARIEGDIRPGWAHERRSKKSDKKKAG